MSWIEILLIILGVVAFFASFIIKGKQEKKNEAVTVDPEIIRELVEKEMSEAKERVSEVVDETLQYAVEKTERASERISNEKILAISEYSDTVLADINKNHQEVMFLYDMLNEKHNNIKETVKQVDKTAKEAKEITKEISESTAKEAEEKFETYSLADQAPHLTRSEIAVAQVQPQQAQQQTAQIVQMPVIPQPEPVETVVEDNVELAFPVVESVQEENIIEGEMPENNNDRILEMHKAGVGNVEIAKELGLGVGEVKLVINLFKGAI